MVNISSITTECTRTDEPLITIVMAVYKPNMQWFAEQLRSLNDQIYSNLELLICDDCPEAPIDEKIISDCITRFPYKLFRNEKNLGSNLTFERLTQAAQGNYIAYCDQDDIWLPEKLSVLAEKMEQTDALLVCSDMLIIDGNGEQTADSITKVRRHHRFYSGDGLADKLIFHNWVTGCTMLVRGESAKSAVPFCPYMVHDHYIALCCAAQGKLETVSRPLIKYRIHGSNQTGLLAGVNSRSDYVDIRIRKVENRLEWLNDNFPFCDTVKETLQNGTKWVNARITNMSEKRGASRIWEYRRFDPKVSLFEILFPYMPQWLFRFIIKLVRKNRI